MKKIKIEKSGDGFIVISGDMQEILKEIEFQKTSTMPIDKIDLDELNEIDRIVLSELKEKKIDIVIYNEGDQYDGEKFSRVEISLFDHLLGVKHNGVIDDGALGIYQKHYQGHYERFSKMIV